MAGRAAGPVPSNWSIQPGNGINPAGGADHCFNPRLRERETIAGVLEPKYNSDGLVPAIAQDAGDSRVLMLAWMDAEAWRRTLATRQATYWSRSRKEYWVKGQTSGHTQYVREVRLDCDGDTVLLKIDQVGPACHTGAATCFDVDEPLLADGPLLDGTLSDGPPPADGPQLPDEKSLPDGPTTTSQDSATVAAAGRDSA